MSLILKGGKIVSYKITYFSDIKVDGEKIVEIGENLESKDCEIVDVSGSYIIPGGVDTHTHFDLDTGTTITADDFISGTKAAIAGGTTTILDFATQSKGKSLKAGLEEWHHKARNKAYCDYGFHMAITDWSDSVCDEMDEMIKQGVSSFKLYMAYKGTLQVDDSVIYKALEKSKNIGAIIGFHCENGDLVCELVDKNLKENHISPQYHAASRPPMLEAEATSRLMKIAEITKSKVCVVHLSCKESLDEVLKAKERGVDVVVETCPQYLLLNEDKYKLEGFEGAKYVMSPPLRNVKNNDILWKALEQNQIDTIGTDHCSFNYKKQKELGMEDFSKIPNGAPGVEHRVGLLYTYGVSTNKISINRMVELLSTNPAKIYGLYPQKGAIEVGSDADLVVLNPNKTKVIKAEDQVQNVDYTPYENYRLNCEIERVYLRGKEVSRNGKVIDNFPTGKYLKRSSN
ncbi:dihydropyrimidinase [Romboutsia ilealis]|uniref:Dihydropyrimidinase n=1 Tax=Romboutsia faecis TaxID=2764597 RepID=A0ABR7JQP1_9FIRM|nr:dihydropyrimidinase [Romboutsia faecis]MBC5997073.1 dihydropyrimidinase [Romboutsia faecis]MRN25190.1 dihydropyrimidinase [Romboutsia ilealis]